MKKTSTTALTDAEQQAQNDRYAQGHEYDVIIIGSGNSALTAAALLAKAGKRICILEAHDIPGGYLQSFKRGEYWFCAQVHYTWGCAPGGKIYDFLEKLGLEKDITFELYDPKGYDIMVMPDGKRVPIPYGWDKLVDSIDAMYPGERAKLERFTAILAAIRNEVGKFPARKIKWWEYVTRVFEFRTLLRYRNATLQDVFEECGLSKAAQAVLSANAGDMMSPPEELSIFSYIGLFGGYNTGAYYPTKHFKYYVDRIAQFITDQPGCHIYYETKVTKINVDNDKVVNVTTADGKTFSAPQYICNMDPQLAAHDLIGWDKFPAEFKPALSYKYCPSGLVIYLGLKDIDLTKYKFGKFNTWHLGQWDMNQMWKDSLKGDYSKQWVFISTPTLHSSAPGNAPAGHHIMEIAALTDYDSFKHAQDIHYRANYIKMKDALTEQLLDFMEANYIPDLRKHIHMKVVGTSVTNEDYVMAPFGTAYGSVMNPHNMGLGRLKAKTPWPNLFWCNSSSGFAGVYGTVSTGMQLYMDMTGDYFYDGATSASDEELIAALPKA